MTEHYAHVAEALLVVIAVCLTASIIYSFKKKRKKSGMPKCMYCGGTEWYEGPTGGMMTNILCANKACRHWFNFCPSPFDILDDLHRVEPVKDEPKPVNPPDIAEQAHDEIIWLRNSVIEQINEEVFKLREENAAMKAALEKVRSYNIDIIASRINYRPQDHIDVIDSALRPQPKQ